MRLTQVGVRRRFGSRFCDAEHVLFNRYYTNSRKLLAASRTLPDFEKQQCFVLVQSVLISTRCSGKYETLRAALRSQKQQERDFWCFVAFTMLIPHLFVSSLCLFIAAVSSADAFDVGDALIGVKLEVNRATEQTREIRSSPMTTHNPLSAISSSCSCSHCRLARSEA